MVRHNNQLPDNLPQLQNLIKRDPASYKDEVSDILDSYLVCEAIGTIGTAATPGLLCLPRVIVKMIV
jgi:hypothetical protein